MRCEAELLRALDDIGLRVADGPAEIRCAAAPSGGYLLEARGPGVRGYLLAEDGEEAELQDMRRLILMCCQPQREIVFSGSALIATQTVQVISYRATHDGRTVKWTATRTLVGKAAVRTLRDVVG